MRKILCLMEDVRKASLMRISAEDTAAGGVGEEGRGGIFTKNQPQMRAGAGIHGVGLHLLCHSWDIYLTRFFVRMILRLFS